MAQVGQTARENASPETSYFSAEFTLPALQTNLVIPHGLAKIPKQVWLELKCVTADLGYAVGDRIAFYGAAYTIAANAQNITLVGGNAYPSFVGAASNAAVTITVPANWLLVVKAQIAP